MFWEELTAKTFADAVEKSQRVCLLPIGVMERHGDHLPLGTDLYLARAVAARAAELEPVVIFPPYYFSQIFEAMHHPGTVALSSTLQMQVLQAVCDEIARNGFTKIVLLNGHGGNDFFLRYFCQTQLERPKNYAVYLLDRGGAEVAEVMKQHAQSKFDWHGGEWETSTMLAARPDLVDMDEARRQPPAWGEPRFDHMQGAYTFIYWYARFPDHYAGDGACATEEKGRLMLEAQAKFAAEMIRKIKADGATLSLQNEFFGRVGKPEYRTDRSDQR
jgi:creatinine amidohydrolase